MVLDSGVAFHAGEKFVVLRAVGFLSLADRRAGTFRAVRGRYAPAL
jgi:hypothetical protein